VHCVPDRGMVANTGERWWHVRCCVVVFEFYIATFLGHVIGMCRIFIACDSIEGHCLPVICKTVDLQGHHRVMFLAPVDEHWADLDKSAAWEESSFAMTVKQIVDLH